MASSQFDEAGADTTQRELKFVATKNTSKPFHLQSNASKTQLQYITYKQLQDFWRGHRIRNVLEKHPKCDGVSATVIKDGYLRVFSLLVWCGKVNMLKKFTSIELNDNRFPLRQIPESFAANRNLKALYKSIEPHQWIFFPLIIHPIRLSSTVEPMERILPIISEEKISSGEESTVFKTLFHVDCCADTLPRHQSGQVSFHG